MVKFLRFSTETLTALETVKNHCPIGSAFLHRYRVNVAASVFMHNCHPSQDL
jgi:hypothetical protein